MKTRHGKRGSVLITVMIVLILASIGALALTLTLQDYARMEQRGRGELQAFYAAESGAMEIVSWFNTAGSVIDQIAPTLANLFVVNDEDQFENLNSTLASGPVVVPADLLPVLRDASSTEVARVTSLEILPPTAEQLAQIPFLLCVVRSKGITDGGNEKTVYAFVSYHRMKLDGAPGVILSKDLAAFGGNVGAHWGQIWAKENIFMPNRSQLVTQSEDPWLKFRTEASLVWGSTWKLNRWGVPYEGVSGGSVVTGTHQPCDGVSYNNIGADYGEMMWQGQTLNWPVYDYQAVKELAKSKGRYYSTDPAGNVYRDGIEDADHLVSDLRELNTGTLADRADWTNLDYDVVFVDTTDGNPPAADGSNMTSLRLSGGGFSWKGFYYVCANLDISGMGRPSAIPCADPGGTDHSLNIFMDGILVVKGQLDKGSGNNQLYGTVYAEKGYVGTGTLDVYYNINLKDGFPVPITNSVELMLWKVEG